MTQPERKDRERLSIASDEPKKERPSITGMDVRRSPQKSRKRLMIGGGIAVVVALLASTMLLDPALPAVDESSLLFGTVERGSFVREVRGPGTLVPEEVVYVSALTGGRVDRVLVDPGETVTDTTLLLVMSNPDVELEALQGENQLTAARASLVQLERDLGMQTLQRRSQVAQSRAAAQNARREAEVAQELLAKELISPNEAQRQVESADALAIQVETQQGELELLERTVENQLSVQRDQVARLAAIRDYQRRRVASMEVRAGSGGVLQDLSLEVGQWVQPGTQLARVAQPGKLKAELRVPETQARDVQIGQAAIIDTRTDSVAGSVRRIDPNVQNGTVMVEVRLEGDLPPGARSDLSVDGTIEIERLDDVLHMERPAYGQANGTVSLFRMVEGSDEAERVTVRLGQSSVNRIEIVEGLREGDRVVLSDLPRWQDADRIRIR
ncbi:MAG: HlyD family efflux transporter periplasmic adaptor subunit [Gemmatimonadota bacterium]|nr:HlyD family efflux transporter periplasmic adaptor subunit [Gemmatimonadota bacterium]